MSLSQAFLKGLFLLTVTVIVTAQDVNASDEEIIPFPTPTTGEMAPAFSEQGIYGETYTLDALKGSPAVLVFGTSW